MIIHALGVLANNLVAKAVLAMLLHSLWMGAVMALLAGIIILITQKLSSRVRYVLLTGLLTLFLVSVGYVFYTALVPDVKAVSQGSVITGQVITQQAPDIPAQKDMLTVLILFIKTHSDTIITTWLAVILLKCLQLVSGLRELHYLRRKNVAGAGGYWNGRITELAVRAGISKTVILLQSSVVKIPMIIGHLKPVILFPIGLLNALPVSEVEAILLHELAHIKRNDFLINLLQRFAEIFFFFNPAVLWVSSLIKNERENCCDDIAIDITHDRKKFIHALVAFQEYNSGLSVATTFPGSKNHLLNRVKRIITNNNKTLNNMEKLILAFGIIVTCFAAVAFSSVDVKNNKPIKVSPLITATTGSGSYIPVAERSTVTGPGTTVSAKDIDKNTLPGQKTLSDTNTKRHYSGVIAGKKIELTEENNQVKELYVDGKKIPEEQYGRYKNIIGQVHEDIAANTAKLEMNSALLEQQKENLEEQREAMNEAEKINSDRLKEQKETLETQHEESMKNAEKVNSTLLKLQKETLATRGEEMKKVEKINSDLLELQKEKLETQQRDAMDKADIMKKQSYLMKQDFSKQNELLKQKQDELKGAAAFIKERMNMNEAMMKTKSLKKRADILNVQEFLKSKELELQRETKELNIRQQKLKEILIDTVKIKREIKVRPVINSKPAITTNAKITVKSTVPVKPVISESVTATASPVISVKPVAISKPAVYVSTASISEEIIDDLKNANIITSQDNLSFRLTNDELVVNGVKQPAEIHKKMLQKYAGKQGSTISLSYNNRQ